MKITINVDVSPAELREFFGLPDVQPLQSELMDAIRERMLAGVDGFDAVSLMKAGVPTHLQNLEAFQRAMWSAMTGTARGGERDDD